jgi:hypothetical protein
MKARNKLLEREVIKEETSSSYVDTDGIEEEFKSQATLNTER